MWFQLIWTRDRPQKALVSQAFTSHCRLQEHQRLLAKCKKTTADSPHLASAAGLPESVEALSPLLRHSIAHRVTAQALDDSIENISVDFPDDLILQIYTVENPERTLKKYRPKIKNEPFSEVV